MIMMKIVIKGSTEASEFSVNAAFKSMERKGRQRHGCVHACRPFRKRGRN